VRYLVDANVLSEPTKPVPHAGVVDWLSVSASSAFHGPRRPVCAGPHYSRDLILVTRNRADFEKAGLDIVDPFAP
jgi:predicted nucleic acid-binding protein